MGGMLLACPIMGSPAQAENTSERAGYAMEDRPKPPIRGMLLVWLIGLTLGIVAGAATAMLLMPPADVAKGSATIAEQFRGS